MERISISNLDAANLHGVCTNHERMPNGELRFRLTNSDGNDYIRTEASQAGAWQIAHCHMALRETYIVERGWIAIAEPAGSDVAIVIHRANGVTSTTPGHIHNVYVPGHAVIHTVKHGSAGKGDWHESPDFTAKTSAISEKEILLNGVGSRNAREPDKRFEGYVALYNNLDNLIWQIPGYLVAGAAILLGFAGSVLSRETPLTVPPVLFSGLFFLVGLLFFLSAYSMSRIREHHTMAGEELRSMEPDGYFHRRRRTVRRRWPPSATLAFGTVYWILCVVFWGLALTALIKFSVLVELLKWSGDV